MTRTVTQCGVCESTNLRTVLDLGSSPPTCYMPKVGERPATEGHHPLTLLFCERCGLAQLSVIVDAETLFPPDFPYSSGNSKGLHDNFTDLAEKATTRYGLTKDSLVVDIGANDGTLLSKFDCRTVGVEPTKQAKHIKGSSYEAFFSPALAEQIVKEHGPVKVVTACNVLAHVEDIHGTMEGIKTLLADDGVLIAENHDLASVVDGQWDTIYHEHLRIYSPASFYFLLRKHGMGVRGWQSIPTHGGSFRTFAGVLKNGIKPPPEEYDWDGLTRDVRSTRRMIRDMARGVWGIGATARATTIINYCGLDVEDIECVCEVEGSDKIGRCIPGTRIPVVDERELLDRQLFGDRPDAILFSWHLADSIVPKLRERGYEGSIYVPLGP